MQFLRPSSPLMFWIAGLALCSMDMSLRFDVHMCGGRSQIRNMMWCFSKKGTQTLRASTESVSPNTPTLLMENPQLACKSASSGFRVWGSGVSGCKGMGVPCWGPRCYNSKKPEALNAMPLQIEDPETTPCLTNPGQSTATRNPNSLRPEP